MNEDTRQEQKRIISEALTQNGYNNILTRLTNPDTNVFSATRPSDVHFIPPYRKYTKGSIRRSREPSGIFMEPMVRHCLFLHFLQIININYYLL